MPQDYFAPDSDYYIQAWFALANNQFTPPDYLTWEEMWGADGARVGGGWSQGVEMHTLYNRIGANWLVWALDRLGATFNTASLNSVNKTITGAKLRIYVSGQGTYHRLNDYGQEEMVGDCPAVAVVSAPDIYWPHIKQDYGYLRTCNDVLGYFPADRIAYPNYHWIEAVLDIACIFNASNFRTGLGIRFQNDIDGASPPEQIRYALSWPGWQNMGMQLIVTYDTPLNIGGVGKIITLPATDITSNSAVLHGNNSNGAADCYFSADTGDTTPETTSGDFSIEITGLEPGTEYWYAAVGSLNNGEIQEYGEWLSFTTLGGIITLPATDLDWFRKSATLNGESTGMAQVYFKFDINEYMGINSVIIPASGSFSVYMHNVYQNRTYYFQAVGIDSNGNKYYGEVLTFELTQTEAAPAYVTKLIIRGQPLVPLETMTLFARDASSIANYGKRTYSLSTQFSLSQDDTQVILNEILADNKGPRINNLIVTFQSLKPGALKDSVITADISTRITLINTLLGIYGDFFINNIKHTVTEAGLSHAVQWRLERAYETTPAP